ncbi:hypothetical protein [uncultured Dokdonia sp.]|uniref:hypothetical protein n=1 Tax=uncultured Dokdonia sp. TaxID=575653 RepID=UPI002603B9A1|nr:hypothetical protein [uncultured Dokdonia sp.]
MKKSLYFLVLLSLLTSCFNDSLQNREALEILKKEYKNPCAQQLISSSQSNWDEYNTILKNASDLEDKGYVKISVRQMSGDIFFPAYTLLNIEVVGKGNDYLVGNDTSRNRKSYAVATPEITNIIGISQDDNTATVRFSYTYTPTPLHSIRISSSKRNSKVPECTSGTLEGEVTLRKFDTGWTIE